MAEANESLAKATCIQAVSAIVLSILTFLMLVATIVQIKKQNDQYQVINRPIISCSFTNNGYINQGAIEFFNQGNLRAKNLMVIWTMVKLDGDKKIQEHSSNIFRPIDEGLAPEETFSIDFTSTFAPTDDPVFLVVVWAYSGPGIRNYRFRDIHFYWNTNTNPMLWIQPNPFDSNQRSEVTRIKSKLKDTLRSQIKPAAFLCESCNESG